jgi:hypothetical protein
MNNLIITTDHTFNYSSGLCSVVFKDGDKADFFISEILNMKHITKHKLDTSSETPPPPHEGNSPAVLEPHTDAVGPLLPVKRKVIDLTELDAIDASRSVGNHLSAACGEIDISKKVHFWRKGIKMTAVFVEDEN